MALDMFSAGKDVSPLQPYHVLSNNVPEETFNVGKDVSPVLLCHAVVKSKPELTSNVGKDVSPVQPLHAPTKFVTVPVLIVGNATAGEPVPSAVQLNQVRFNISAEVKFSAGKAVKLLHPDHACVKSSPDVVVIVGNAVNAAQLRHVLEKLIPAEVLSAGNVVNPWH